LQRRSGDLDDREVLKAMEAQRQLDEPELGGLDPVWADLRLAEPDLVLSAYLSGHGSVINGNALS